MSNISSRHTDQHFVITGAGTGIGRAIALRLASEGARVTLFGRRHEPLQATAALAVDAGSDPATIRVASVDVRDSGSLERAVSAAAAQLGPLRGCIANAGIGGPNFPDDDDRFEDILATNVTGAYHTVRAAQRHLARGPDARHLVLLSSILGRIGVPWYTAYCASKAALLGLTRALAAELAREDIQVNAVCPGWVATDMASEGIQGMAEAMKIPYAEALAIAMKDVPLGRMSQPEDIAGLIAWLVSADARGVTGQGMDINGGAFMS